MEVEKNEGLARHYMQIDKYEYEKVLAEIDKLLSKNYKKHTTCIYGQIALMELIGIEKHLLK